MNQDHILDKEESLIGFVETIEKNESTNPKAPVGFVYFKGDERKFTVWGKTIFDKLVKTGKYKITFKEKENKYGNTVYKNYTLIDLIDQNLEVNTDNLTFTKEQIENIKTSGGVTSELKEGNGFIPWEFMGYPIVIDESVKEIKMPKKLLDYIMELKLTGITTDE